jgi:XTP/dITP diphosphohydrolase
MDLIIATKNKHKLREIGAMLAGMPVNVIGLDRYPQIPETVEDGNTFEDNALKKAREVFAHTRTWTLADDSGLEVKALNGAPGVYSARYAGEGASYEAICKKLLREMQDVPLEKRTARFNCTMALIEPSGKEHIVIGYCKGHIGLEMRGSRGFGYDPVFVYDDMAKTLAEMSPEEKNAISHRGQAVKKVRELIKTLVENSP